jgi:hypothetical protein
MNDGIGNRIQGQGQGHTADKSAERLVLLHHAPTAVYHRLLCIEYRLSVQRSVMLILSEIAVVGLSQWVVRIRERLCGTSMMDCLALVWQ